MDQTSSKVNKTSSKSPEPAPRITKFTVFYVGFVCLWTILATYTSQFLVACIMVYLFRIPVDRPGWMLVYYIITYAISLALIILVPPRLVKIYQQRQNSEAKEVKTAFALEQDLSSTPTDLGMQHLPTFVDIGLAPIGYIVYTFIAGILVNIMSNFPWFDPEQSQDVGFGYFVTNIDRIFAMLAVVFIAPIVEEIIMRGWLYGKLRRKLPVAPAIIIISLIFALLHGQWNVAVTTFVLSCVLCVMREITGTIWSGMLLHILSNGIAFYLLYVAV